MRAVYHSQYNSVHYSAGECSRCSAVHTAVSIMKFCWLKCVHVTLDDWNSYHKQFLGNVLKKPFFFI